MSEKSKKGVCASWKDSVYSSSVSVFAREGNLDGAFLEVVPYLDWGALTFDENERICNEYGDYAIPFYECIFSIQGLRLPFTVFKMEVLKQLIVAPSKLYPTS